MTLSALKADSDLRNGAAIFMPKSADDQPSTTPIIRPFGLSLSPVLVNPRTCWPIQDPCDVAFVMRG